MVGFNIEVEGRVQGVGFRYYSKLKAEEFHLKGLVENLHDGSVRIHVEGEEENISEFIKWCHNGPITSEVSKLEYNEVGVKGFTSFEIKR